MKIIIQKQSYIKSSFNSNGVIDIQFIKFFKFFTKFCLLHFFKLQLELCSSITLLAVRHRQFRPSKSKQDLDISQTSITVGIKQTKGATTSNLLAEAHKIHATT